MINRATLIAAFLFLISAVLGKASAADLPTVTSGWRSAFPYPVPRAADFVVTVSDNPTTTTLGAAPIPLRVAAEFRGKGVVWQARADEGGPFVVECLAGCDGLTTGSLLLQRVHDDRPCEHWTRHPNYDGVVFSSAEYLPAFVREDYLHASTPSANPHFGPSRTTAELAQLAEIFVHFLEDESRNFTFTGPRYSRTLDLRSYLEPWKAGTYRLRVGIYVYPSCVPPAKRTLLATREIAWSEPFDLIVEPGPWGATLGGPGATDVEPRN